MRRGTETGKKLGEKADCLLGNLGIPEFMVHGIALQSMTVLMSHEHGNYTVDMPTKVISVMATATGHFSPLLRSVV